MRLSRGLPAVCAGVVLATSGAVPVAAEESGTLTGTYRRVAKEVVLGGVESHAYDDVLVTPSRTYRLRLRGARPASGSTVRVSASTTGTGDVEVTGTTTLQDAPVRATTGSTSTLAILVHWGSPDSLTQTAAQSRLFGDANTWLREVSYGQTSLTGAVTPWLRIVAPTGGRCYDYADQIMSRARAAALNAGYRYDQYHRTLVYFPRCTASDSANLTGWAFEPGDSIWLNGVMDRRTSVHEHGHSFGMSHARSYACTSFDGVRTTLGGSCSTSEYGDPYDAMGNSAYAAHYNGYHKDQVGWLGGTRKHVLTTSSATFTLPPFERASTLPVAVAANGHDYGRYWLEYRQPVGMDAKLPAGATGGVMVHLVDARLGGGSLLLDLTPSDGTFNNAVLGPGRSWTSPDGVRIAVNSVSTSGASVTVTGARPEPSPPSAPRDLTVQAGDGRALLQWLPPAYDGNAYRRRYLVSVSNGATYSLAAHESSFLVPGLQNGVRYTASVVAHNEAGAGAAAVVSVTPAESAPPVLTVTSPASGSTVSGTVTVQATVQVGGLLTAPETKQWYVDGAYVRSGQTFTWDTVPLANGRHTVLAVGHDELNRQASAEAVFEVDNVRPSVSLTSPAPGARVTGGIVTVTADAGPSPDGTPVQRVDLIQGGAVVASDWSAPYTIPWDVTGITGSATLTVRAVDTAGRWTTSAPAGVTVYHDPPRVTITSPTWGSTHRGTQLTLTADATPATPGVPIWYVTFSGSFGTVTDYTAPYATTFGTSGFTGSARVEARAVDVSGRSAYTGHSISVDNALPAVAFTSPEADAVHRGTTVTLAGTVARSSAGTPISRVTLDTPTGTLVPAVHEDGTWTATWNMPGRYGRQRVTATVTDTSGYWASAAREFVLERPAPAVTFVPPSDGTVTLGAPSELRAVVEPAPDAVHWVTGVCFWEGATRLGCAQREADGKTWVARDARAWVAGSRWFSVQVSESDGYAAGHAGAYVGVYAPPAMPYDARVSTGPDATVQLRWSTWWLGAYQPSESFVVRDMDGTVVAQATASPVTFRPPRTGDEQRFTIEAVSRWGTSEAAYTPYATPVWQTRVEWVQFSRTATTYPGTVTVTARLVRWDGQPVAGRRLSVSGPARNGTWLHWVMPPTSSTGFTTVTVTPPATATLTVAYGGGDAYGYSASHGTTVTVRALVTGTLRSGRIALGGTTYLDGRVQTPRPRRYVYLQRFYAGAWRTVTYREQDASGRVAVPIKPPARGTYQYRLYFGGDPALAGNVSPARTLSVV